MAVPSVEETKEQMRLCLDAKLDWEDLDDWVHDVSWGQLPAKKDQDEAESLIASLCLMFSEMTCSGSYRTEEMLRADFKSILAGLPPTAFWRAPKSTPAPNTPVPR